MENFTTTQLIQEFLEKSPIDKFRKSVFKTIADKEIIQKCEEALGVNFVDMNYDQFLYVIENIVKVREKSNYATTYDIYYTTFSLVNQLFTYYSQNICPTRNPFYYESSAAAYSGYLKKCKRFTMEDFEGMSARLHNNYDEDYADYLELILQLAYCGFQNPQEIPLLKKEDIDFGTRIATVQGHKIQLTERCLQLLSKFEYMDTIQVGTAAKTYYMSPWRGSYFKFNIRLSNEKTFDDRDISTVSTNMISKKFIERIAKDEYVGIKYSTIVLFGFYNFCLSKVGAEELKTLLSSDRNRKNRQRFEDLMEEYDFRAAADPSRLKVWMRCFLPEELL